MCRRLNVLTISKHIFTLLALGLVLAVCSGQVSALEVEIRLQPFHPVPYVVIDDPSSSLPPEQLSIPFCLYICDFRGERPKFSLRVRVYDDYDVRVGSGAKNDAEQAQTVDKKGMRILETYLALWHGRWDNPSANDGENDIILKNWDDCVNFLEAFTMHYTSGSPYVFYEKLRLYDLQWYLNVEMLELKVPWKDYELANHPDNNIFKIPVDELRDFLTGQGKWTGWKPPKQGPDK